MCSCVGMGTMSECVVMWVLMLVLCMSVFSLDVGVGTVNECVVVWVMVL